MATSKGSTVKARTLTLTQNGQQITFKVIDDNENYKVKKGGIDLEVGLHADDGSVYEKSVTVMAAEVEIMISPIADNMNKFFSLTSYKFESGAIGINALSDAYGAFTDQDIIENAFIKNAASIQWSNANISLIISCSKLTRPWLAELA